MQNDNIHKSKKSIKWILCPVCGSKTRTMIPFSDLLLHVPLTGSAEFATHFQQ